MSGEIPMPAATPLIERLWGIPTDTRLEFGGDNWCSSVPIGVWCEEAANEIERLQVENDNLRAALTRTRDFVKAELGARFGICGEAKDVLAAIDAALAKAGAA